MGAILAALEAAFPVPLADFGKYFLVGVYAVVIAGE